MMINLIQNEKVIFPCYMPGELVQEDERFNEAYKFHMMPESSEDIVAAVHGYHEAFINGCPEAGANILNIVCKTIANGMAKCPSEPKVFQDKLVFYIGGLIDRGYEEIGRYYAAIALIYNLFDTEDEDKSTTTGFDFMNELADQDNTWALDFLEYVEMN